MSNKDFLKLTISALLAILLVKITISSIYLIFFVDEAREQIVLSKDETFSINIAYYIGTSLGLLAGLLFYHKRPYKAEAFGFIKVNRIVILGSILIGLGLNGWLLGLERIIWGLLGGLDQIDSVMNEVIEIHSADSIFQFLVLLVALVGFPVVVESLFFLGPIHRFYNERANPLTVYIMVLIFYLMYRFLISSVVFGTFTSLCLWIAMIWLTRSFRSIIPGIIAYASAQFIQVLALSTPLLPGYLNGTWSLYFFELIFLFLGYKILTQYASYKSEK